MKSLNCLAAFFWALAASVFAAECGPQGRDAILRGNLDGVRLGKGPGIITFPCDTMYVTEGDTVDVAPDNLVQFSGDLKGRAVLRVDGALWALGKDMKPILFARGFERTYAGHKPMETEWDGIRIGPKGSLWLRHAEFYQAYEPIRSQSQDYYLRRVSFRGGSVLVFPDQSRPLEPTGEYVEEMVSSQTRQRVKQIGEDVAREEAARLKAERGRTNADDANRGGLKKSWIWLVLGIALISGFVVAVAN